MTVTGMKVQEHRAWKKKSADKGHPNHSERPFTTRKVHSNEVSPFFQFPVGVLLAEILDSDNI